MTVYGKNKTEVKTSQSDLLKKILDISAEKNRNLLIVFLSYLATAVILCLSINDYDLLLNEKTINIPLLSVGLPVWAFYTIIPFILLLLHFDVLHNAVEHNAKLDAWLATKPQDARRLLFPFVLDFTRVRIVETEKPNSIAWLVQLAVWLMYVYLPLFTMVMFFIRFADLQKVAPSLFHLTLLVIDLLLLRIFNLQIERISKLQKHNSRFYRIWQYLCSLFTLRIFAFTVLGIATFWILFLWSLLQWLHYTNSNKWPFSHNISNKFIRSALDFEYQLASIAPVPIVPRLVVFKTTVYQVKDDDIRLQQWLAPTQDKKNLWEQSPPPFYWAGRRLAYAYLSGAILRRIDLNFADLQGAVLDRAQLQNTHLVEAQLQNSTLIQANLEGANLTGANLKNARIWSASLQGVSLVSANLQYADFSSSNLQGADLGNAHLQYADLSDSQLQGVGFFNADLQGANISNADLQGAYLNSAKLQYANLQNAKLEGAILIDTKLKGVVVKDVDFTRAWVKTPDFSTDYNFNNLLNLEENESFDDHIMNNNIQMQQPLGVSDVKDFRKTWLNLLCNEHYVTKGMLRQISSDEMMKSNPPYLNRKDVNQFMEITPFCTPYRSLLK